MFGNDLLFVAKSLLKNVDRFFVICCCEGTPDMASAADLSRNDLRYN